MAGNKNNSFEDGMSRLEEILDKFNDQTSLDEAVSLFQEAEKILNHCQKKLDETESHIQKIISQRDTMDAPSLEPFKFDQTQ